MNESVQGPHDLDNIRSMKLDGSTKICPEGSTEWISIDSISKATVKNPNVVNDYANFSQDSIPTKVGKYKIISELGRGGMGAVYLAMDEVLNRKVAVKELKIDAHKKKDVDNYNTMIKRFSKEAQILAQLNQKNIVSVYDIIEQNGSQYIIMEFLDGKNLEELLNQKGHFSLDEATSIIADTALALDYIHKKNIIHRDVKPSNIIILTDGVTKLTDFGVTKDMNSSLTMDGSLVGTIAYASPEQDSKELDGRSDIFSLGIVLYELVTGQKPFVGDTIASVLLKIATKDPTKPSDINPEIHKMLEAIILKSMAKNVSQRYATAMDMFNDLQTYRQALFSNNTALLSGMKVNESFFGQNKNEANKDNSNQTNFLERPISRDVKTSTLPPMKLNLTGVIDKHYKDNANNSKKDNHTVEDIKIPKLMDSVLEDDLPIEEIEEHIEPEKKVKKEKKKKQARSNVSEQIEQERKKAFKKIAVPAIVIFLSLILFITGIVNLTDTIFISLLTLVAHRDYNDARAIKSVSYLLMFMNTFSIFVAFKMLVPSFGKTKIQPYIFYSLDTSLIILSFVISFFMIRGLYYLSSNKNKNVRPIGSSIKSILAFLSIILIVSSTSLIKGSFVGNQFKNSKFANAFSMVIPDLKLGKHLNVSFGKPVLKSK
ncbi:MAG: serine/threonine protein kinase [Candidatus Sericytochromatia bacterium]|nr:serine/threonine protein kinase [Candidatus Sericytochromatia bacterium]